MGWGYIIIGIAEKDGQPILPPIGLQPYVLVTLPAHKHFSAAAQTNVQEIDQAGDQAGDQATAQATARILESNDFINKSVQVVNGEMKASDILPLLGLKHMKHFRKEYLLPSIEAGYIEMTIPDKPSSPNQKYRLTPKGTSLKAHLLDESGRGANTSSFPLHSASLHLSGLSYHRHSEGSDDTF